MIINVTLICLFAYSCVLFEFWQEIFFFGVCKVKQLFRYLAVFLDEFRENVSIKIVITFAVILNHYYYLILYLVLDQSWGFTYSYSCFFNNVCISVFFLL